MKNQCPKSITKSIRYIKQEATTKQLEEFERMLNRAIKRRKDILRNKQNTTILE